MLHLEKFVLKKPYDMEVSEQYYLKISDRFAAFYDLYDNEDRQNIKISTKEGLCHYEW